MGAPTFTVGVRLTGTSTQLINAIQAAIGPTNQLNARVGNLNANLGRTANAANVARRGMSGFASSVGAFYLLNKASQYSTMVMKQGFQGAANLQLAIAELGVVSGASAEQLSYLRNEALRLSSAFGPIDVHDVVKGMTELSRIVGPGQQRIIADFTPQLAAFQNAMVLISGGTITATQAAQAAKTSLAAFGGFGEGSPERLQYMNEVLDLLFKTSHRFSGGKLQEIMRAVNVVAPTMTGLGMSPLDIFSAAALRTLYPTGGLRASGADISAAINSALEVQSEVSKGSKAARAAKKSAFLQLGLMTPAGAPTIIDPKTGRPSLDRFFTAVSRSVERIRGETKEHPEQFAPKMAGLFETAFTRDIGKRFMSIFMQPGALAQFHTIQKLLAEGKNPEEISRAMETGLTGAMGRVTSNWENLLITAFMGPAGGLATALDGLAEVMNRLTIVMAESPVAASAGGVAAIGGATFGGLGALSTMFLGAGHALRPTGPNPSFFAWLIPAILTALGRTGAVFALGAGIASLIGIAIMGSIAIYEYSPKVRNAINSAKEAIKGILRSIIPSPQEIESGKREATWEATYKRFEAKAVEWTWLIFYEPVLQIVYKLQEAQYWVGLYVNPIVESVVGWFKMIMEAVKAHIELFMFSLNPMNWPYMEQKEQQLGLGEFIGPPEPPGFRGMAALNADAERRRAAIQAYGANAPEFVDPLQAAYGGQTRGPPKPGTELIKPGGLIHGVSKFAFAPPTKVEQKTDAEKKAEIFQKPAKPDQGEDRYPDLGRTGVREGNSNAKVAANRSQVETYLSNALDKIVTQQAGGMARTGTINRGLMPLRRR